VLEVVYNTFAIQEIHGSPQKVPLQRLCKPKTSGFARDINDANNFFKGDYLNGCDENNDVDVAHENGEYEAAYHDNRPD
jgi:hypothetical protein